MYAKKSLVWFKCGCCKLQMEAVLLLVLAKLKT